MAQKHFRDTLLLLASTLAALCLFLCRSTEVLMLQCTIFFLVLLSVLVEKPSESRPFRPAAAGLAAMEENEYYLQNARTIIATRDRTADALRQLGFAVTDSRTNFLFVSADWISGGDLYRELKARGILIRHWDKPRIGNWCRVTVGTDKEMDAFLAQVTQLRKEVLTNG